MPKTRFMRDLVAGARPAKGPFHTGTRVQITVDSMPIKRGEWGTVMGVTGALVQVDFDNYTGEWGVAPSTLEILQED